MPELDVTTEQMTFSGAALARHEGRVLFIPYALPGERVRVWLPDGTRRWAEATLLAVLDPSPERVEPRCAHFGPSGCGGCQWQHADYAAQLRYKTDIVREQLQRIGKISDPPVAPCLGVADPWHYRNHVQLHTTPDGPGFVRANREGVEPLRECHLMNRAITPLFETLIGQPLPGVERVVLRGSEQSNERLLIWEGAASPQVPLPPDSAVARRSGRTLHPLRGEPMLHEELGGRRWQIGASSFFQVHTAGAALLLATVRQLLGPLRGDERLVDGYAGGGLFGLSLAGEVGHVWLVESHPAALADAQRHAEGLPNVSLVAQPTERALPRWAAHGPPPDIVLLDPPRAGCKAEVLEALGKMGVPTIIYVACDPATQARDVRLLLDAGFLLEQVQPVDMFPQTYHIEAVARLSKR